MTPLMDKLSASFSLYISMYVLLYSLSSPSLSSKFMWFIFFSSGGSTSSEASEEASSSLLSTPMAAEEKHDYFNEIINLKPTMLFNFLQNGQKSTFYIWRNLWNSTLLGKPIILNWNYISTIFTFGVRLEQFPAFIRCAVSLLLTEKRKMINNERKKNSTR